MAGALAGLAFVAAPPLAAQAAAPLPLAVQHPAAGAPPPPDTAVAAPGESARIEPGQTLRGRLEPGDLLMADSTLADVWAFDGAAGETVTVGVRSDEFDTYLEVLDAGGTLLGHDDDSGGDLNSRLTLTLPATGTYRIVVNSAGHERRAGRYAVSLKAAPPAPAPSEPKRRTR